MANRLIQLKQIEPFPIGGDKHYTHTQEYEADLWHVRHMLKKEPAVRCRHRDDTMYGIVNYVDDNYLTIRFSKPVMGFADCN